MSRVRIELPGQFAFATELPVMVGHINSGNHLGNDSLIGLINEARARYVRSLGLLESDSERGLTLVNADMAIVYQSEGCYGEQLCIEVAATDFHRCGFDLVYRVTEVVSGRPVATAKTAHILLDMRSRQAVAEPAGYFDCLRTPMAV